MDNKKNGIPKLRFPGFTGAWEQRKFGGVFSILKNNTLSRANLSDEHGAAQDIHYGDILTKFNETLDISTTAVPYIQNEEVIEKTKATLLKNGDIVLADTAEDETAGKCTEIVGLVNQKVFAGLHTIPLRPNQSFSKGFLGFYMNSIAFRDQLKSLMQGIKVLSISKKALKETVISFPHDLREQEKIGQHLSNIDTLIALHQRKLEHLQEQKKGLLQKMFPKNGEVVPEVRFPGFTDAWEQRKLGEIGKVFTGNTPSTKNTENWTTDKSIGHVWITPTDINNNIMFDSERYLSDKGWSQARVVPKNSVLITSIASIGKNAINGVEVAFNQQINALVVQKNNPYFILTLMNKEKQRFESLAGQTATPIINKSTFSSFMVKIPSETEQEQIGEFFKQLDSLIALHQRKLEHLELMKKGLLQQMFV